ncbi:MULTISPECIES: DUF1353 domain-containing protein [unclassified Nitratiruptor]|uniref:DUF1353 domain-containing protein n=1 Tax=unclassified Nitratiruptor TaxID=2624044 RepID=UPI001915C840|nr:MULTISPECIES: DUF1353 domain-containing protein [unclassified Nitratiruptor]BCD59637.1 hypothetical protein NitYY0810_C0388 [Nitratiruptor sp. YY08-10]BCD63561.1 hypothetical protein NitYY0814_C0388 [Nitratiruptor sp. YY08-14]BCD83113.1 hypothetical protein NrS2_63 [Nitratiruptor phage NrS-2]BCD83179.1 hypothetical protein NrS3_63 [Nitratiruptor phage NrS-3]
MFIGNIVIDHVEGTTNSFEVVLPFRYKGKKWDVAVKGGWVSDGASVPKIFWNIFPPVAGRYLEAAILHDALYKAEILPRKECDLLFLEAMEELGVKKWKRLTMYYAVRMFGWRVWRSHKGEEVLKAREYIKVKPMKGRK